MFFDEPHIDYYLLVYKPSNAINMVRRTICKIYPNSIELHIESSKFSKQVYKFYNLTHVLELNGEEVASEFKDLFNKKFFQVKHAFETKQIQMQKVLKGRAA